MGADLSKLEAIYKKYGAQESKSKPASAVSSGCSANSGNPVKAAEIVKTIKIVEVMSPAVVNDVKVQSNTVDSVDV